MTRTRSDGFVVDSGVTTSLFGGGGWPGHRGGAHSWIGRGARGSAGSTNASSISASGSSFSSAPACEQTEQTTTLRREPATRARAVGRARWRARSLSLSYSARSLSLSLSLSPSSSFATVLSPSSSFATVFGRALLVLPRTARLCALLPRNRRRGEKKASVSAASRVAAAFGVSERSLDWFSCATVVSPAGDHHTARECAAASPVVRAVLCRRRRGTGSRGSRRSHTERF